MGGGPGCGAVSAPKQAASAVAAARLGWSSSVGWGSAAGGSEGEGGDGGKGRAAEGASWQAAPGERAIAPKSDQKEPAWLASAWLASVPEVTGGASPRSECRSAAPLATNGAGAGAGAGAPVSPSLSPSLCGQSA